MAFPKIIFPGIFKNKNTVKIARSDRERRNSLRVDMIAPLVLRRPAGKQHDIMRDISEVGLRLESEADLGINGVYDFEISLPEGPKIKLGGEVKWKKDRGGTIFYGIKFNNVGFLSGVRLKSYLRKHEKSAI